MSSFRALDTLSGAFGIVFYNVGSLARLATPTGVALIAVAVVDPFAVVAAARAAGPNAGLALLFNLLLGAAAIAAELAALSVFAAAWLRFTDAVARRRLPAVRVSVAAAELRVFLFLGAFAGLGWLMGAFLSLPLAAGIRTTLLVLVLIAAAGLVFVFARLALILPAIAAGESPRLRTVWQRSRPLQGRLAGVLIAAVLPFCLAALALSGLGFVLGDITGAATTFGYVLSRIVEALLMVPVVVTMTATVMSVLSLAYLAESGALEPRGAAA